MQFIIPKLFRPAKYNAKLALLRNALRAPNIAFRNNLAIQFSSVYPTSSMIRLKCNEKDSSFPPCDAIVFPHSIVSFIHSSMNFFLSFGDISDVASNTSCIVVMMYACSDTTAITLFT